MRNLIRTLLYAAVAILVMELDLFGMSDLSRPHSAALYNRVMGGPSLEQAAGPKTSVITVTDATLQEMRRIGRDDANWPLDLQMHAMFLNKIREFDPAAVMVDVLFVDKRSETTQGGKNSNASSHQNSANNLTMRSTIASYHGGSDSSKEIPLYFASSPTDKVISKVSSYVERDKLVNVALTSSVSSRTNPLVRTFLIEYKNETRTNSDPSDTAAFEMAEELLGHQPPSRPLRDLRLLWPEKAAEFNRKRNYDCNRDHGFFERVVLGIFAPEKLRQSCPPMPTAPAHALLSWRDPVLKQLIEDRVVFYGAGLQGSGDMFRSPVNGYLHGIYAHATAFENLRVYGDGYKGPVSMSMGFPVSVNVIEGLIVVLLSAFTVGYYNFWSRYKRNQRVPADSKIPTLIYLLRHLAFLFLAFILVGICTWLSTVLLDLYPIDWISLFALVSLLALVAWQRPVEALLDQAVKLLDLRDLDDRDSRGGYERRGSDE